MNVGEDRRKEAKNLGGKNDCGEGDVLFIYDKIPKVNSLPNFKQF